MALNACKLSLYPSLYKNALFLLLPCAQGWGKERMVPELSPLDLKKEWRICGRGGGAEMDSEQDRMLKDDEAVSYLICYRC